MQKKSVIVTVILTMLLLFATSALAYEGSGTAEDPYLVGNYDDLVAAVNKGGHIKLTANIPLASKYNFPATSFTIDGQNSYGFIANNSSWPTGSSTKHLVGINTGNAAVTFQNLTFDCATYAQGLNVYQASNVTMDNVAITNTSSKSLAVLTVNGSNVTVINGLDITGNLAVAIDVSKGSGVTQAPSFILEGECTINGLVKTMGSNAVITLYAGTYNRQPNANFIAEGYYAKDNGDKTWTILPITYTISFATDEGFALEAVSVPYGKIPVLPAAPAKEGHRFEGWYTDSGLTTPYDESVPLTGDITLYARWSELPPEPEIAPEPTVSPKPVETEAPRLPVTGDSSKPMLWMGTLLIAVFAAVFMMNCEKIHHHR